MDLIKTWKLTLEFLDVSLFRLLESSSSCHKWVFLGPKYHVQQINQLWLDFLTFSFIFSLFTGRWQWLQDKFYFSDSTMQNLWLNMMLRWVYPLVLWERSLSAIAQGTFPHIIIGEARPSSYWIEISLFLDQEVFKALYAFAMLP